MLRSQFVLKNKKNFVRVVYFFVVKIFAKRYVRMEFAHICDMPSKILRGQPAGGRLMESSKVHDGHGGPLGLATPVNILK